MEALGARRGELTDMQSDGKGRARLEYRIPARGLIGFQTEFLNLTRGTGLMSHVFDEYDDVKPDMPERRNGVLISAEQGVAVPYAAAAIGVLQSLWSREETRDIVVADSQVVPALSRHATSPARVQRPLKLVQITDPHLGPFMSVARLWRICQRAIEKSPDLVLLTGDFLTMESQADPGLLEQALSPLKQLQGRVFACLGNHDHEALLRCQVATGFDGGEGRS